MDEIFRFVLYFVFYSIIGYLIEITLTSIRNKRFTPRGFLFGPYCPVYGFGSVIIILTTEWTEGDFIMTFLMAMVVCSTLEYFTSYILEKIFKVRFWDYHQDRYNLNGRICMASSLGFGFGGSVIVYKVQPVVERVVLGLPGGWLAGLAITCVVILAIDTGMSIYALAKTKGMIDLSKLGGDQTREIKKNCRKVIQQKLKKK